MSRQTKTQVFIETATEEQWQELAALVKTAPSRTAALPTEEFPFSYASISPELEKRGLIERKKRTALSSGMPQKNPDGTVPFFVADSPVGRKKVARSVQLYEDIYGRLQAMERDKGQYTHTSILNQLLDDALSRYGY